MIPTWMPNKDRTQFTWKQGELVYTVKYDNNPTKYPWWCSVGFAGEQSGVIYMWGRTAHECKQAALRHLDQFLFTGTLR